MIASLLSASHLQKTFIESPAPTIVTKHLAFAPVTPFFKSSCGVEVTKSMDFVTSTPHEDLKKGVTGAKARCLVTMVGAGDSMKVFCRWEAESKDAIIEQLGDMNSMFTTDPEECGNIMDFRN